MFHIFVSYENMEGPIYLLSLVMQAAQVPVGSSLCS